MEDVTDEQQCQEKLLAEDMHAKNSEIHELEYKLEILKAVGEMLSYDTRHTEHFIEEINKGVQERRCSLLQMKLKWTAFEKSFEETRILLQESFSADKPEQSKRLQQLKEIKLDTDAILLEICKRDDEYSELVAYLENQPKVPTRKSYIRQIAEITKNSWKLDTDIQQITKDTRELQIENNSISDRLHRIYAVVDETIFREAQSDLAKKDLSSKDVYRLLTGIHDSFRLIAEKILLTDRARRESAGLETKLANLVSHSSMDIEKLQAELDAVMRKNEFLEQQLSCGH